jgi:ABC-type multidrug transport system fused ATPase/permease subunit
VAQDKVVEPWPLWGRVVAGTLIAIFFVVMVVSAIRGGFSVTGAGLRIYLAAVLVPALLVLGVSLVLARRAGRLDVRLAEELTDASRAVEEELRHPSGQRATGAPDDQLHRAARLLQRSRRALAGSWSADAPATRAVARAGTTAGRLDRTVRSLSQQRR